MATKDPAFLFYSKDWLQGTAQLMPDEKGVFIDLLAHQHQDSDLPNDTKRLARIVGMSEAEFLPIWAVLKEKFNKTDNNRLVNRKLTEVSTERSTKGLRNRISGTFASIIRLSTATYENKIEIKKLFVIDDFIDVSDDKLTERLTEWFKERLKSIEDANGIGIIKRFSDFNLIFTDTLKQSCLEILTRAKFGTSEKITQQHIDNLFFQFCEIQKSSSEPYKDEDAIWVHFKRWLPKQKINGKDKSSIKHNARSQGAYDLLNKIKTETNTGGS